MVDLQWEDRGVVRRFSGVVTIDELDISAAAIQADPRIDALCYSIHDFRSVTELSVDDDDIEFLALRAAVSLRHNTIMRIAYVGDHPVITRLIDAFNRCCTSHHRCHRFATLSEARRYTAGACRRSIGRVPTADAAAPPA